MDTNWQATLGGILGSYFGDQTMDEGIDEYVFVSADHEDYHRRFLAALDAGIAAAAGGDPATVQVIDGSFAALVQNPTEAGDYLKRLRAAYLARYREETEGRGSDQ